MNSKTETLLTMSLLRMARSEFYVKGAILKSVPCWRLGVV